MIDIIAQALGLVGLVIIVLSFQCKSNRNFFLMQGTGSFMFFLNFILIGAVGGALFNLANLVRGLLFSKDGEKPWKLKVVLLLYTVCFLISLYMDHSLKQIVLVFLPYSALMIMSVLMNKGNAITIRKFQIAFMSPAWIIHNIFNFSLGGIICETFNMVSSFIFLQRKKLGQ